MARKAIKATKTPLTDSTYLRQRKNANPNKQSRDYHPQTMREIEATRVKIIKGMIRARKRLIKLGCGLDIIMDAANRIIIEELESLL